MLIMINILELVHILNLRVFWKFAQSEDDKQMKSRVAQIVISSIMRLIQLRWIMSNSMKVDDLDLWIDVDIFSYKVTTVKLIMNDTQQKMYNKIYDKLIEKLRNNQNSLNEKNCLNMTMNHQLIHTTLNLKLNKLIIHFNAASVKNINKWYDKNNDYKISWYHQKIRLNMWSSSYKDRLFVDLYISMLFFKLFWLVALCHQICKMKKKKILIFVEWSMMLWNTSVFLMNIKFRVIDIWSVHIIIKHQEACDMFNDKNELVNILLTFLQTTITSMNLQKNCANIIFINVFININTVFQAIERIYCIDQTQSQRICILTLDELYDQIMQFHAALKMISQISSIEDVHTSDEIIQTLQEVHLNDDDEFMLNHVFRNSIIIDNAIDLYMQIFDLSSSRHQKKWENVQNFKTKNDLSWLCSKSLVKAFSEWFEMKHINMIITNISADRLLKMQQTSLIKDESNTSFNEFISLTYFSVHAADESFKVDHDQLEIAISARFNSWTISFTVENKHDTSIFIKHYVTIFDWRSLQKLFMKLLLILSYRRSKFLKWSHHSISMIKIQSCFLRILWSSLTDVFCRSCSWNCCWY